MIDNFLGFSYVGIVLLLILTGVGLPIPEEAIVIVAGVAAAGETLNPWGAWAACIIGALLGDTVTYAVGRKFGYALLRDRHWYSRLLTPARERQMEQLIHRHGIKVFFVARFLVGFRSPIYLTAGILRVPFRKFMLVNASCAVVIISVFFWASYVFAARIEAWFQVIRQAEIALSIAVAAALVGVGVYFYLRHRRRVARVRQRQQHRQARSARNAEATGHELVSDESRR